MSQNDPTVDDAAVEQDEKGAAIETHLKSRTTWLRGLFMLLACVLFNLAAFVGAFFVVIGFFWVLFTGETNRQLTQAGQSIASYLYQIVRFLTYNTEQRPFPFGEPWPSGTAEEAG